MVNTRSGLAVIVTSCLAAAGRAVLLANHTAPRRPRRRLLPARPRVGPGVNPAEAAQPVHETEAVMDEGPRKQLLPPARRSPLPPPCLLRKSRTSGRRGSRRPPDRRGDRPPAARERCPATPGALRAKRPRKRLLRERRPRLSSARRQKRRWRATLEPTRDPLNSPRRDPTKRRAAWSRWSSPSGRTRRSSSWWFRPTP